MYLDCQFRSSFRLLTRRCRQGSKDLDEYVSCSDYLVECPFVIRKLRSSSNTIIALIEAPQFLCGFLQALNVISLNHSGPLVTHFSTCKLLRSKVQRMEFIRSEYMTLIMLRNIG